MSFPECKQAEDHSTTLVTPEWAENRTDFKLVAE